MVVKHSLLKRVITIALMLLMICPLSVATALSSALPVSSTQDDAASLKSLSEGDFLLPTNTTFETNSTSSTDPLMALQTIGLGSPHWNWGSVSMGGTYDTLLGMIFDAEYAETLGSDWAVGFIGEYGSNQYRLNGTLGRQLWKDGQVKFTSEYLSQVLPFDFDSGSIDERVSQTAYGLTLQQNFGDPLFQDVNFGGYWSKAPNVKLSDVEFTSNGLLYTNQRNLAGAVSMGANLGTDLRLTDWTGLGATLFYDNVTYHTEFTDDSSANTFGAGGALALNQVVTDRLKFSIKSEVRALYNTYGSEVSWWPLFAKELGLHFSVFGQRLVSHNETPSSNSLGLSVGLLSDDSGSPHYGVMMNRALGSTSNLLDWVKSPAVYMERVMMIAEEQTTLNAPLIDSIEPSIGPVTGGNTVAITGSNFLPGVTVTFAGVAGEVTLVSSTELSVVVPPLTFSSQHLGTAETETQEVTVVVTNTNGQQTVFPLSYTYTTAFEPGLTDVSPSSGPTAGETSVTLTGTQLTGTTSVTFGEAVATDITVGNDSTVTVLSPPHQAGTVTVTLTTPGGVSALADSYTYLDEPTVTNLSVNSGSVSGGTSVTITGTHFTSDASVAFGTNPGTNVVVVSETQITVNSPAGTGTVDVRITTPGGTSAINSNDEFTYTVPVIYLTASTYSGNLGGLSGADAKCNSDTNKPGGFASAYTYKALLFGNASTTVGRTYYRADGVTIIAVATTTNLTGSTSSGTTATSLQNSISTENKNIYTGAGGSSTCTNWTSTSSAAQTGSSNSTISSYWRVTSSSCSGLKSIYCVSQ